MILRVHFPSSGRWVVSWISWLLIAGGLMGLAIFAWSHTESWFYQEIQRAHWERPAPDGRPNRKTSAPPLALRPIAAMAPRQWVEFDPLVLGTMEVPRLGLSAIIRDGVDSSTLRKAVGHVTDTPLPGQPGNSVVAGHRDTFFRGLQGIERGDRIRVVARNGIAEYAVDGLLIVGPEAVEVMRPTVETRITLITCYPFGYVGPAPRRFVVTARLIPAAAGGDGH